jgi:hypothetical protein
MPQVRLVRTAAQAVQADEQRLVVVGAQGVESGVGEVCCAGREVVVAYADGILGQAYIVRDVAFCVALGGSGWWGGGDEVDGEVACEGVLVGNEGAALVVDWRAVEFHCGPEGLQVAIGEEGVEVAGWDGVGDEGGEGA